MIKKYQFAKGNIHDNFQKSILDKLIPIDIPQKTFELTLSEIDLPQKESCLEISHQYSPLQSIILNHFKKSIFLSDDAFESLLVYHHFKNENLNVYQIPFQSKTFEKFSSDHQVDLVFSYLGIPYKNLKTMIPDIISLIKVNGYLACVIPAYWYYQEELNEDEKKLLSYSKQNDQDWLFTESLDSSLEENGSELVENKKLDISVNMSIIDVSYLAGLTKLYKSIVGNNEAHLEVADLPEEMNLNLSLLIIKKHKKTITMNNLFSS